MATITIPDFEFSGLYYPDILADLIDWTRVNVPEITEETPYEPFYQIMRAFSLTGHLVNVNVDATAVESLFGTCKLAETSREHLKLIGYEVETAIPASGVELIWLTKTFNTTPIMLVPDNAKFATKREGSTDSITYEANNKVETTKRTDQIGYVYAEDGIGNYADFTAQAIAPATPFSPWTNPILQNAKLYMGHPDILFDKLDIEITTGIVGGDIKVVYEYYDGNLEDDNPDTVTDIGGALEINVDTLLNPGGAVNNRQGAEIRVYLNSSGAYEDLVSTWSGSANIITTTGYLGQTVPSTNADDYTVGTYWHPFINQSSAIQNWTAASENEIEYTLPKNEDEDWNKENGTIPGLTKSVYWVRIRVTEIAGVPNSPALDVINCNDGKQYVAVDITQGLTRLMDPLDYGTGLPDQSYKISFTPVIGGTILVYVFDGVNYQEFFEQDNFLSSRPFDKHFTAEITTEGVATITFGDGVNGSIPASGRPIRVIARTGADTDGNAGSGKVVLNQSGLQYAKTVTNPRSLTGWQAAEDADEDGIAQLKVTGPASLRALGRAVSVGDVEYWATSGKFRTKAGASPWVRAKGFEEGYGPKTIKTVVVAAGGGTSTVSDRGEFDEFLNGNPITGETGILVANQQNTTIDYTQNVINIVADVYGATITAAEIEAILTAIVQPEALEEDGITYVWQFGEDVAVSKLEHVIFDTDTSIWKVEVTSPAADVVLTDEELPKLGTVTLNMIP